MGQAGVGGVAAQARHCGRGSGPGVAQRRRPRPGGQATRRTGDTPAKPTRNQMAPACTGRGVQCRRSKERKLVCRMRRGKKRGNQGRSGRVTTGAAEGEKEGKERAGPACGPHGCLQPRRGRAVHRRYRVKTRRGAGRSGSGPARTQPLRRQRASSRMTQAASPSAATSRQAAGASI